MVTEDISLTLLSSCYAFVLAFGKEKLGIGGSRVTLISPHQDAAFCFFSIFSILCSLIEGLSNALIFVDMQRSNPSSSQAVSPPIVNASNVADGLLMNCGYPTTWNSAAAEFSSAATPHLGIYPVG